MQELLDRSAGFSGVVILADERESSWFARGLADDRSDRAFIEHETWRWASVTKQVIAVLVMQEIEAGRLTLDTQVHQVWPEFRGATGDAVTVLQLLQHTSGLPDPDDFSTEDFVALYEPAEYCQGEPLRAPGEVFNYNNCDYWLLGELVNISSGLPWEQLLRERILEPAGMSTTRVGTSAGEGSVTGYASAGSEAPAVPLSKYGPAGALIGEAQDLIAFDRALMSGRLLSQPSLAILWDGDPALGYVALGAWSFAAALDGCEGQVQLIERRGYIAGVSVRNFIAPELGRSLVAFVNRGDFEFGEVWMGAGFSYDLASEAFCRALPWRQTSPPSG